MFKKYHYSLYNVIDNKTDKNLKVSTPNDISSMNEYLNPTNFYFRSSYQPNISPETPYQNLHRNYSIPNTDNSEDY